MNKKGFSLSEMLLVVLVVAIVAGAVAPMMSTPKKLKRDTSKVPHGIFECYYKGGVLYQYTANNKDNKNGTVTNLTGDTCTFNVPEDANYYRFQLIGPGGRGSTTYFPYESHMVEDENTSGSVDITEAASLPNWVKTNWHQLDRRNKEVKITVYSGHGAAGKSYCSKSLTPTASDFANNICRDCFPNIKSSCRGRLCVFQPMYRGGDSGRSKIANIYKFEFDPSKNSITKKITATSAQACLDGACKTLTAAGAGTDATAEEEGTNGSDAIGEGNFNSYASSYVCKTTDNSIVAGDPASSPSVDIIPSKITYSQNKTILDLKFGANGGHGKSSVFVYPYLGGKQLKITPGKNGKPTKVNFGNITIGKAESGDEGYGDYKPTENPSNNPNIYTGEILKFDPIQTGKMPVNYKPKNVLDRDNGYQIESINDTGLISKIEDEDIKPGLAGTGTYPFLNESSSTSVTIMGQSIFAHTSPVMINRDAKCLDGNPSKKYQDQNQYYCDATDGNNGAVRIVW